MFEGSIAEHGTTSVASQRDGTLMVAQQDGTADRVLLLPSHELDLIGSDGELRPLGELGCRSARDRDLKCSSFEAYGLATRRLSRTFIVNSYEVAEQTLDNIASASSINAVRHTTDYATIYERRSTWSLPPKATASTRW